MSYRSMRKKPSPSSTNVGRFNKLEEPKFHKSDSLNSNKFSTPNSPKFNEGLPDSDTFVPHLNSEPKSVKRGRHWKRAVLVCSSLLLVSLGGLLGYRYYQAQQLANALYVPKTVPTSQGTMTKPVKPKTVTNSKPISILLLGTDTGALGRDFKGRTDTIIIATLNPKKQTMYLTSLPRDLAIRIPNHESEGIQKLNAAYAFGGINATQKVIEKTMGIPISYYALLNMGGLEKVVDAVGGVDVTPPLTFHYQSAHVTKGKRVHLNGKEALAYSRMRHEDPRGDYGRQTRQRQIIMATVQKANSYKSLFNPKLFASLKGQLQTDVDFNTATSLYSKYHLATHHQKSNHLQGNSMMYDGQSFEVAPESQWKLVSKDLHSALGVRGSYKSSKYALTPKDLN